MTYSIGQLASLTNVNKETIRYYERKGLMPSPERDLNAYRIYTEQDKLLIEFIKKTKSLGFSLDEIFDLISLLNKSQNLCDNLGQILSDKISVMDKKINHLKNIKEDLQLLKTSCNLKEDKCPMNKSFGNNYFSTESS